RATAASRLSRPSAPAASGRVPGAARGPRSGRGAGSGLGVRLDRAAAGPAGAGGHPLGSAPDAVGSAASEPLLRGRLGRRSLALVERGVGLGARLLVPSAEGGLGLQRAVLRVPR